MKMNNVLIVMVRAIWNLQILKPRSLSWKKKSVFRLILRDENSIEGFYIWKNFHWQDTEQEEDQFSKYLSILWISSYRIYCCFMCSRTWRSTHQSSRKEGWIFSVKMAVYFVFVYSLGIWEKISFMVEWEITGCLETCILYWGSLEVLCWVLQFYQMVNSKLSWFQWIICGT